MRKVIVLTPSHDRNVGADYHFSMVETVKLCSKHNIDVDTLIWPGEALVQHARNVLADLALKQDAESVVWIDADQEWRPQDFLRLINHKVDVVGATYRKKGDKEEYPVRSLGGMAQEKGELLVVDGLGTGFLKVSMNALRQVWQSSEPYEAFNAVWRMIFDVQLAGGRLWAEDIVFCVKLAEAGYQVHLDPSFTVGHIGKKNFKGDFRAYLEGLKKKAV